MLECLNDGHLTWTLPSLYILQKSGAACEPYVIFCISKECDRPCRASLPAVLTETKSCGRVSAQLQVDSRIQELRVSLVKQPYV